VELFLFSCYRWQSAIFSIIQSYEIVDHGLVMDREPPEKNASSPKLLIFVNPNSGPGFAVKNFNRRVRPLLGEANISYDLVVTSHRFQCQKMIEEMPDLTKYAGLVAVSGDGLLFEVKIIDHVFNLFKNNIFKKSPFQCRFIMV